MEILIFFTAMCGLLLAFSALCDYLTKKQNDKINQ